MKKFLYKDLYELEDRHWWHVAKRKLCLTLLTKHSQIYRYKQRILDIGCGTGLNLKYFSRISSTWGVDGSKKAISFCRLRGLEKVKLAKAQKIPFPSRYFTSITLLDVLEHTDEDLTLKEIYRLLKPRGIIVITVPAYQWLWSKWDEILHHRKRYSKKSLSQLLSQHKLNVVKISYLYSTLVIPTRSVRSDKSMFTNRDN